VKIINLFQLGVGLIPAVIVMAALIFRRQITKKRYIFAASAVLSVCIVCMLASIVGKTVEENTSYKNVSKDITLNMCYAMMGEGNYAVAGQMLDDFAVNGIYDKDVSLARARSEVLCGSYKKAFDIAAAAGIPTDTKEMRMLSVLTDERNTPDNASATMYRAFVRTKCSHMCEEKHRKTAKLMVGIENLYSSFTGLE